MIGEEKTKIITRYGLIVKGEFIRFRTKALTIETGKQLYEIDKNVKMIEKYTIWALSSGKSRIIDRQEFDRTILIRGFC